MLFVLVVLSLAYAVLAVIGTKKAYVYRDRLLYLPVTVAVVNEAVCHVFPAVMFIFGLVMYDQREFFRTAIGSALDFAYIICWLLGFFFMAKKGESRFAQSPSNHYFSNSMEPVIPFESYDRRYFLSRLRPILWFCLACILLHYPLARLFNWPTGYASGFGTIQQELGPTRFVLLYILVQRTIQIAAPVASVYIMLKGEKVFSYKNILPLSVILMVCLWALGRGSRGMAATPLIILTITAYLLRQKVRYYLVGAAAFVVFLIIMSPAIRAVRGHPEFEREQTMLGRVKVLFQTGEGLASEKRSVIAEGAQRFNNAWTTGLVYEKTPQTTGFVGIKPYRAVPFLLIPRHFWPGKPLIGSYDNTYEGILYNLSAHWVYGTWRVSLTPGPGAQPYWAAGWLGVFLIGLLGGLVVGFFWSYLRISHHPIWLVALLATLGRGVTLNLIYYDVSWTLQWVTQNSLLIFALWFLTVPFGQRSTEFIVEDANI